MSHNDPRGNAICRLETPTPSALTPAAALALTIFGCGPDEAALFQELAPRHGVVPTLAEAPLSEANAELAFASRCVSVSHKTEIANAALLALSSVGVRYLSTRSAGHNHIDVEYAASVGITVGNVAYSPDSVADYTLMLILMALRDAKAMIRRTDAHDYRLSEARARELRDLTVGVVGTGRIGAAVIDRLKGFGCRILAYDARPKILASYVSFDDLLRQSDIVSLHTPLSPATHHLLDQRRIEQMKPGAIVVNTGRGALVETTALAEALVSGRLAGAALDVVEGEEGVFYADCRNKLDEGSQLSLLQRLPNVTVSPHTAYYTDRALRDTVENTIANCLAFERGTSAWTG